jgi:hypothetical protein
VKQQKADPEFKSEARRILSVSGRATAETATDLGILKIDAQALEDRGNGNENAGRAASGH